MPTLTIHPGDAAAVTAPEQNEIKFSRVWAMPNSETFSVPDIGCFVKRYLLASNVSIDPFARNKRWATFTNDLNPATTAKYHMEAVEFLKRMADDGIRCDLMVFDPPYSPRQISECYSAIGKDCGMEATQNGKFYSDCRNAMMPLLQPNAIVLSFGWNSAGMGKERGFEILEIMLVCHGGAHNDTICIAERRRAVTGELAL